MAEVGTSERKRSAMTLGAVVYVGLIVLDAIEFVVAQVARQTLLWMALLAIPQAGLILWFYMHLGQLRREEAH
jgi:heme/copper-type cytochrome/quinol oxidase subunit 4